MPPPHDRPPGRDRPASTRTTSPGTSSLDGTSETTPSRRTRAVSASISAQRGEVPGRFLLLDVAERCVEDEHDRDRDRVLHVADRARPPPPRRSAARRARCGTGRDTAASASPTWVPRVRCCRTRVAFADLCGCQPGRDNHANRGSHLIRRGAVRDQSLGLAVHDLGWRRHRSRPPEGCRTELDETRPGTSVLGRRSRPPHE